METKSSRAPLIIVILIGILAIASLPGYFTYFYRLGAGHAFMEIATSQDLSWDSMSQAEREPYIQRANAAGVKCAVLMALGQHIPFFLFILITVGLFTRSISCAFRVFLRLAFFGVWLFGMLFLSLGTECWGQGIPFPQSLGPAFVIYIVVLAFFGIVVGVGKLCQRRTSLTGPVFEEHKDCTDAEQGNGD